MIKTISKSVETLIHDEAKRKNIPTAEFQSVLQKEAQDQLNVTLPRGAEGLTEEKANRNRDLDPKLVWRGKDEQDWSCGFRKLTQDAIMCYFRSTNVLNDSMIFT